MYKIGEFSKKVDIPVRTLRFYDELGVLEPKQVDSETGYRYYTEENIIECKLIKLLKSVEFTLEEITNHKNNLNQEILIEKQKEILEQIETLKKRYKRLTIMREEIKNSKNPPKIYKKIEAETNKEKIIRRKYEKRKLNN